MLRHAQTSRIFAALLIAFSCIATASNAAYLESAYDDESPPRHDGQADDRHQTRHRWF